MANTVANVTTGKPKVGGAIFRAPLNTSLPVSASEALDAAFKGLGYISDDGVTNSNSPESDKIKAWGGDTVVNLQKERPDEFKFKLVEAMNVEVLKMAYGNSNVTGTTIDSGLSIKANGTDLEESAYVIDMALKGGVLKRIVIPNGKVTELEDISYTDEDAVAYGVTISCLPDTFGNTHYEYIIAATQSI